VVFFWGRMWDRVVVSVFSVSCLRSKKLLDLNCLKKKLREK